MQGWSGGGRAVVVERRWSGGGGRAVVVERSRDHHEFGEKMK